MLLDTLDIDMLAASKVACLIDPKREAPRDLYDLHVLVLLHARPPIEALRKFGSKHIEQGLAILWDKIEKMDYAQAAAELLPHLEPAVRSRVDKEAWDEIRLSVGKSVESWLKEAAPESAAATAPGIGR
jgi:hypothetical protein